MKKLISLVYLLIPLFLILQSCEDLLPQNIILNNKIDRLLWKFSFKAVPFNGLRNNLPAIDEENNIYLIAENEENSLIKLNKNGEELWTAEANTLSRVSYYDHKIIYTENDDLVCVNAITGSEIWRNTKVSIFDIFALTPDKIYTTNFIENGNEGSIYLYAFNYNGDKLWETKIHFSSTDMVNFPFSISVNGNSIYLGVLAEIGDSEYGIIEYKDNGNSVSKGWTWLAPEFYTTKNGLWGQQDFAIADNGDLVFGLYEGSDNYVFSVNASGTSNWSVKTNVPEVISNVSIDKDGNAYVANQNVQKISNGNIVWTSDKKESWEYEGLNSKAPAISEDGNVYMQNLSKILSAIDKDGNYSWDQFYEPVEEDGLIKDDEFHNITINRDGNIIIIGRSGVFCFSGDGTELAKKGWPKMYGNYGNTSSR